jgi:hypothetical protein
MEELLSYRASLLTSRTSLNGKKSSTTNRLFIHAIEGHYPKPSGEEMQCGYNLRRGGKACQMLV